MLVPSPLPIRPLAEEGWRGLQSRTLKIMFFTYVIRSMDGKHRYVGHCKNLRSQLNQHNARNVRATRDHRPWEVIYSEKFKSEKEAIFRGRFFKSTEGQKWLNELNL